MKIAHASGTALLLAGIAAPAAAGQAAAVLQVRATVTESCSVSAGVLDFALDNAAGSTAQARTAVTLRCNGATPYELALDAGANGEREMVDPASGDRLAYEIYRDPARTARWGNAAGIDTVAGITGSDGAVVHTAYGKTLPQAARIAAGSYSDAVVVTVSF